MLITIIQDQLRIHKILSRIQLKEIARKNGYEESAAERCLRKRGKKYPVPSIKLNRYKKPVKRDEHIYFYRYVGGTVMKK